MDESRLSVVVVTYQRPVFLLRCLRSLQSQVEHLHEVIVVDASSDSVETEVTRIGLRATYIHAPELAGWMTRSRNRALLSVGGDIIAFLDDDVTVRSGWAAALKRAYLTHRMDAAVGRTVNGVQGEEYYDPPIGRLLPDGTLTEGFASAQGDICAVDHGIGANMSFTRSILHTLGGFRDDYPGTALREDTDIFLRIKRLGGTALFVPDAVVDHRPAPHVHGKRFDTRYKLYGRRNHMVLLARHQGIASPTIRRWVAGQFSSIGKAGGPVRMTQRLGVVLLGVGFGTAAITRELRWGALEPRRIGQAADRVRSALSGHGTPSR